MCCLGIGTPSSIPTAGRVVQWGSLVPTNTSYVGPCVPSLNMYQVLLHKGWLMEAESSGQERWKGVEVP